MANYRPYNDYDYKIDDHEFRHEAQGWNQLLDDGEVNPELTNASTKGLAAIAAALHQHAPNMKPEHLEKAVWWLKDWKAARVGWYRTTTAGMEYNQFMSGLKQQQEFKAAGKRARRYSLGSSAATAVSAIVWAGVVMMFGEAGAWAGGWTWGAAVLALFTWAFGTALTERARDIWQLQDRRYFLQCLRAARCTEDLNDAGLFAHGLSYEEPMSWAREKKYRAELLEMQRQLADALYFDYDQHIRTPFDESLIEEENARNAARALKPG